MRHPQRSRRSPSRSSFDRMIAARDPSRVLVFCDEAADVRDPVAALAAARKGRDRRRSPC